MIIADDGLELVLKRRMEQTVQELDNIPYPVRRLFRRGIPMAVVDAVIEAVLVGIVIVVGRAGMVGRVF
ncbi:MAG: hypothetical protein WC980_04135 [Candidatus Brocadiia bacterium]